MHTFLQNLRFGARMLRKNPGFAIAAIHDYKFSAAESAALRLAATTDLN